MNTLWTATEKYVYLWKEICWKMLKLFEMTYRLWQKPAAGSFFSALPPFCHRRTARASEWTRYETREKTRVNPFWNFGIDFLCGTTWFRVCQRRLMQLARQLLGAALPHSYAVAMLSCVILFHIFGSIQFTSIHIHSHPFTIGLERLKCTIIHRYPFSWHFLAFHFWSSQHWSQTSATAEQQHRTTAPCRWPHQSQRGQLAALLSSWENSWPDSEVVAAGSTKSQLEADAWLASWEQECKGNTTNASLVRCFKQALCFSKRLLKAMDTPWQSNRSALAMRWMRIRCGKSTSTTLCHWAVLAWAATSHAFNNGSTMFYGSVFDLPLCGLNISDGVSQDLETSKSTFFQHRSRRKWYLQKFSVAVLQSRVLEIVSASFIQLHTASSWFQFLEIRRNSLIIFCDKVQIQLWQLWSSLPWPHEWPHRQKDSEHAEHVDVDSCDWEATCCGFKSLVKCQESTRKELEQETWRDMERHGETWRQICFKMWPGHAYMVHFV